MGNCFLSWLSPQCFNPCLNPTPLWYSWVFFCFVLIFDFGIHPSTPNQAALCLDRKIFAQKPLICAGLWNMNMLIATSAPWEFLGKAVNTLNTQRSFLPQQILCWAEQSLQTRLMATQNQLLAGLVQKPLSCSNRMWKQQHLRAQMVVRK